MLQEITQSAASGCRTHDWGSVPGSGKDFSIHHLVQNRFKAHLTFCPVVMQVFPLWVNQLGYEVHRHLGLSLRKSVVIPPFLHTSLQASNHLNTRIILFLFLYTCVSVYNLVC